MKQCFAIFFIGLFVISTGVFAADNVHEYKLDNGLKLVVKEDHRAPVVMSEVWYKVGSSYEPNGVTGISHALEHMMFRGTKKYPGQAFFKTIAENGGQQNAFTFYDFTGYYQMLSTDKLPVSFELESDRMRNLSLNAQDFAKEIQVVMEERRMRYDDNPQQLTFQRFLAAANIASPYHHPVIGWMGDLKQMSIGDLRNWYKTWYAPNNAVIVVVGDVNPAQVYQLAQKYFGPLKPSILPELKAETEVPPLGTRTVVVEVPAKLPQLLLGYNTPVLKSAQEKWEPYALLVLSRILAGGDSARLPKDLVRGKQIVTDIDADYYPYFYFRLDSLFTITATPAQGHTIDEVKSAVLDEIKQVQNQLVDAKELARVKAGIIASKTYQEDSLDYQAFEIGSLEATGLSWREVDESINKVNAVTAEQVQAVARKYLTPERLTIGILKPLPLPANQPQTQPQPQGLGDAYVH